MLRQNDIELRRHVPFTAFGALTGIAIMAVWVYAEVPATLSQGMFWSLHPLHVLLSAVATASMFKSKSAGGLWSIIAVGYFGSVGIATLSDSLIPFLGEWMLGLPNRGVHIGFLEKWWLVNPLAGLGIAFGALWPRTRLLLHFKAGCQFMTRGAVFGLDLSVRNVLDEEHTDFLFPYKGFGVLNPGRDIRLLTRCQF